MSRATQFNTSMKDVGMSNRRAVNLKSAKLETQKLDLDNRRMEEKLRELKVAMSKEKEERERKGGSHWSSGQPGAITTHTALTSQRKTDKPKSKKPPDEKKVRKIKILKDEPLDIPERPKFLKPSPPSKPIKGTPCGQCESKSATLVCVDCGEDYCTGCFAQFHLKGALKKHSSVPISSQLKSKQQPASTLHSNPGGQQQKQIAENQPLSVNSPTTHSNQGNSSAKDTPTEMMNGGSEDAGRGGGGGGGFLLQGSYDEEANAREFAQALSEWRGTKNPVATATTAGNKAVKTPPKKAAVATNVETVANTSHGTSTSPRPDERKPLDVHFSNYSLSYADKLLLKKHRRADVPTLNSPIQSESTSSVSTTPILNTSRPVAITSAFSDSEDEKEIEDELQEQREQISGILKYAGHPNRTKSEREKAQLSADQLSNQFTIIDITEEQSRSAVGIEETTSYSVNEDLETVRLPDINSPQGNIELVNREAVMISEVFSPTNANVEEMRPQLRTNRPSASQKKDNHVSAKKSPSPAEVNGGRSKITKKPKLPAKTYRSRSSSGRPARRLGGIVTTAESTTISRPKFSNTGLTLEPSFELHHSGQRKVEHQHSYKEGLSKFFLAGVKGRGNEDDNNQANEVNDLKSSATYSKMLYKGPKTWKPDDSFGDGGSEPGEETQAAVKSWEEEKEEKSEDKFQDFGIEDFLQQPSLEMVSKVARRSSTEPPNWPLSVKPPEVLSDDDSDLSEMGGSRASLGDLAEGSSRDSSAASSGGQAPAPAPAAPTSANPSSSPKKAAQSNVVSYKYSQQEHPGPGKRAPPAKVEMARSSSRIEVDGDDMTEYDYDNGTQDKENDNATLEQLEWELASTSGRITADGRVSQMHVEEADQDEELGIQQDDGQGSGLSTPTDDMELENRINQDMMADFDGGDKYMVEVGEVKALK